MLADGATTCTAYENTPFVGTLSVQDNSDWIKIELDAAVTYQVSYTTTEAQPNAMTMVLHEPSSAVSRR